MRNKLYFQVNSELSRLQIHENIQDTGINNFNIARRVNKYCETQRTNKLIVHR